MTQDASADGRSHRGASIPTLLAALATALPVGGLAWLELAYLNFGLTGRDWSPGVAWLAAFALTGLATAWALRGAGRPAAAIRRGCNLGVLLAILLPIVAVAVLLLWEDASDRPDLGMGGMMLYSMPFVAVGLAVVLVLGFGVGARLAARRMHPAATGPNQEGR